MMINSCCDVQVQHADQIPQADRGQKMRIRAEKRKLGKGGEIEVENQLKMAMESINFDPMKCPAYEWLKSLPELPKITKVAVINFARDVIVPLLDTKPIGREYYRTLKGIIYWFNENLEIIIEAYNSKNTHFQNSLPQNTPPTNQENDEENPFPIFQEDVPKSTVQNDDPFKKAFAEIEENPLLQDELWNIYTCNCIP